MSAPADTSPIFLPGPWTHRLIQANGCQFHIAHMGEHHDDRPLVLLVHGFPEYWWSWRHQIETIAQAGYEVAAIDLRGVAGSDKTPNASDAMLLTQDLAAIVRSLGARDAVVVGHSRGGALAWSVAALDPDIIRAIVTISSPHPRSLRRASRTTGFLPWMQLTSTFLPHLAKKRLTNPREIRKLLTRWSAPGNTGASAESDRYVSVLNLPEAADSAVAQLRWTYMSPVKVNGLAHTRVIRQEISQSVLAIRGALDPILPRRAWNEDIEFARGEYRFVEIPRAGHYVPEENPSAVTSEIISFLQSL